MFGLIDDAIRIDTKNQMSVVDISDSQRSNLSHSNINSYCLCFNNTIILFIVCNHLSNGLILNVTMFIVCLITTSNEIDSKVTRHV